ncbi:MAG: hypothetical protein PHD29_02635 [bacterium]|nr:hypothetical protein [bacterium]MDD5755957.1 hypothetical protein [bacterium]
MKGETKEVRFKRIAERRVQRIIDSFTSLSQCSNKRMYKWSDEQLRRMWDSIESAFRSCKTGFEKSEPEEFRL